MGGPGAPFRAASRLRAMGKGEQGLHLWGFGLPAGLGVWGKLCRLHTRRLFIPGAAWHVDSRPRHPAPPCPVLVSVCAQHWSLRGGCPRVKAHAVLSRSASRGCWPTDSRLEDGQPGCGVRGLLMSLP